MGRATDKINCIADYQAAAKFYENTKHIRGRSEKVKPLGARKDIDRFNISEGDWANSDGEPTYTCTLYRTPVVKFRPNGDVVVRNGGYVTPSTHDFIRRITNVRVEIHEGSSVLSVANGKFKMSLDSDSLLLRKNTIGQYEVMNGVVQHRYKIDRKGTTVIRKRYAEFIKYFDGMLSLRKESLGVEGWLDSPTNSYVRFGMAEVCEVANASEGMSYSVQNPRIAQMFMDYCNSLANKTGSKYTERVGQLIALLNDTSDTQHESYHRAFVFMCMTVGALDFKDQNYCKVETGAARESMLHVLYRWHNSESLTRVTMPMGELGSRKYASWALPAMDEELA